MPLLSRFPGRNCQKTEFFGKLALWGTLGLFLKRIPILGESCTHKGIVGTVPQGRCKNATLVLGPVDIRSRFQISEELLPCPFSMLCCLWEFAISCTSPQIKNGLHGVLELVVYPYIESETYRIPSVQSQNGKFYRFLSSHA